MKLKLRVGLVGTYAWRSIRPGARTKKEVMDEGYASSCVLLSLPVFLGVFTIVDYEMLTLPGLTIFSESPASCSFRCDI